MYFQERGTCPHTHSGNMGFYRKGLSIPGLCNFQGLPCFHPSAVAEGGGLRLTRDLPSLAPGGCLAAFSLGGPHCFLLSCSVHVQKSQGSRVRLRGRSAGSSTLAAYGTIRTGRRYCCRHRALMTITNPFHRKLGEPLPLGPDYPQYNRLLLTCGAEVFVYCCARSSAKPP